MKNERMWREVVKSYCTKESWQAQRKWDRDLLKVLFRGITGTKAMDLLGERPELEERPAADPSVASQLREARAADPFNTPMLTEAYMEALRKCPDASEGTKRKWRKIIGL